MTVGKKEADLFNCPAPRPFNAAPLAPKTNLPAESNGGVVCELRRVWRELDIIGKSIEKDWPDSNAKASRLARNKWMKDVVAEAGRRMLSLMGTAGSSGEEGF